MSSENFLNLLDALVLQDTAPSGIKGRICFGICDETGITRWWLATFSDRVETTFVDSMPDFDAAVGLTAAAERGMFRGQPHSVDQWIKTGDRRLIERFMNRYFSRPTNVFGVRCTTRRRPTRRDNGIRKR